MPSVGSIFLLLSILAPSSAFSPVVNRHVYRTPLSSSFLQATSSTFDKTCDVLVLGSGPAARAVATLLSDDFSVILADQNADKEWIPNFGVWKDEWQAVLARYKGFIEGGNVGNAIDREWSVTDCYFGGSFDIPVDSRMRLDRPYYRVDKNALRDSLTRNYEIVRANHFSSAIGVNLYEPTGSLVLDKEGSTVQLVQKSGEKLTVRSKLVVDCTGHETSLVLKDTRDPYRPPGFQIAYGFLVDVDESDVTDKSTIGPYDKEAMTLFDYRTDHIDEENQLKAQAAPTFMYAMPLKDNKIFFEETSLVARPAISFQECKDRCMKRLAFHNIKVSNVYEEEFCYIPMGGALPVRDQRIIGLGGASAMVHPSTGYHLCRGLMGAADVARVISSSLKEGANLDEIAASCYQALWSPDNVRQRNFAVFGGEFLMKQNVVGLRGFFDGFFRLPLEMWAGFLAGWPGLPNNDKHESWLARILFGLTFITKLPPMVALDMLTNIITYSIAEGTPLLQSVTPFFGEPASYEYKRNNDRIGDVAAKVEARRMIQESSVTDFVPVDFGSEDSSGTVLAVATTTLSDEDASNNEPVESFQ